MSVVRSQRGRGKKAYLDPLRGAPLGGDSQILAGGGRVRGDLQGLEEDGVRRAA